jgi:indole-3-glycerol phosphate synthase
LFLNDVLATTRRGVAEREAVCPLAQLKRDIDCLPPPLSLARALTGPNLHFIAEVKKASPSRGLIRAEFDLVAIAAAYADGGAAAISVLTEEQHFQGSLAHLAAIRQGLVQRLPLLRKDFIVTPYQVYEARAAGADALLLIAAALTLAQLRELRDLSSSLGLEALVEVHNKAELQVALASGADIIGINNRDLASLRVDLATTECLAPLVPPGRIVVSESGLKSRADLQRVQAAGAQAVLIGEAFMMAPDIKAKMRELCGQD